MPPFYLYLAVQVENPFNAARMSAASDGLTEPHIYFAPREQNENRVLLPASEPPLYKGRWAGDGSTGLQLGDLTLQSASLTTQNEGAFSRKIAVAFAISALL